MLREHRQPVALPVAAGIVGVQGEHADRPRGPALHQAEHVDRRRGVVMDVTVGADEDPLLVDEDRVAYVVVCGQLARARHDPTLHRGGVPQPRGHSGVGHITPMIMENAAWAVPAGAAHASERGLSDGPGLDDERALAASGQGRVEDVEGARWYRTADVSVGTSDDPP